MGMFDWVNARMDCPQCGRPVDGFQTKDLSCQAREVDPTWVSNFYSLCEGCKLWIEFNRPENAVYQESLTTVLRANPYTIEEIEEIGFKMTVEKENER